MKSIKHVTNTWLVALHLFPVLFFVYLLFSHGDADVLLLPLLAFFGMLFSVPALLFSWMLFVVLMKINVSISAKLCAWMLAVTLSIFAGVALIAFLFDLWIFWTEMPVISCAIIAALLSILLRTPQFLRYKMNQTKSYEQELV